MSAQKYFGLAGLYTFRSKTWQVRWNCIILVVVLFRETRTHIWTAMPQNMHPSTKCNKCFDCQNRGYILFCKSNECKKYFICRQKFNITIYLTDLFIYKTSLHLYVYGRGQLLCTWACYDSIQYKCALLIYFNYKLQNQVHLYQCIIYI